MTRTLHERPQIWFAVTYDCCLSLRAPQDVVNSFDVLCVVIRNQYDGDADEVLDYFENTYIGRFLRNAPRRPPLFPIELWNRFHRTADELSRTNNNIEAWRNSFQANVSSTHPTFWKFLDVLLREERIARVRMLQNQVGHAPEPQRRRCADCNARILKFVDDYPNRQVMDYLRHIAHQFIITF